ncbi:hypothetical protein [Roseicella aerolata]|uniref:Uncharacterized protein n=1 Tax=Roseicella aerolata TaxID=2883479 RepID=A0A9X1IF72_9PROT|nr:hypothetical protein [Roseicella aerolata]MCB4823392.1 hypothetical protein [Roseicella aerolata]
MPNVKGKGTGEPGWTGEEKRRGAPNTGDAGAAGEAAPKAGYGGGDRAATESAAARTDQDSREADREAHSQGRKPGEHGKAGDAAKGGERTPKAG